MARIRSLAQHAALLAVFGALAIWFTWPIALRCSEPVTAHGDGALFLWNLWWFRHALVDLHANPFFTTHQFHPVGVPLYLHTFTSLRAVAALPLTPLIGLEATHHVLYLLSFVLAGWGMYLLARDLGSSAGPSVFAAVAFAFSQYHVARGYGHFNLTEIQWFPFYFLFLRRGLAARSRRDLLLAALFLLLIVYSDYYYWCYAFLLTALYLAFVRGKATLHWVRSNLCWSGQALERALHVGLVAAGATVLFVLVTGGVRFHVGPFVVVLNSLGRSLAIALVVCALKVYVHHRRVCAECGPSGRARSWPPACSNIKASSAMPLWFVLPFLLGFAPILAGLAVHAAEYEGTLRYNDVFSRAFSANIQSFVIAGAYRPDGVVGRWWQPSEHFEASGMGQYLGFVPMVLAVVGAVLTRRTLLSRFLTLTALVFFDLSLGPVLHVGGTVYLDHLWARPLLLYNALKGIPVLGACRVPSRFVVMVLFCQALLAATGLEQIQSGVRALGDVWRRLASHAIASLAVLALIIELHPGPYPCKELRVPSYYRRLGAAGGTLLDLPLSWASGRWCFGSWESEQFYYQTVHGLPLYSGQVSRVPDSMPDQLRSLPLLGRIMQLQMGKPDAVTVTAGEANAVRAFVAEHEIHHVVLHWNDPVVGKDRMRLVRAYLKTRLDLELEYRDPTVVVWRVSDPRHPPQR